MEKAMEIYRLMKASECSPDKLTFTILIRNLERAGQQELAATLKNECVEYVESPDKFIQELEHKHVRFQAYSAPINFCNLLVTQSNIF